MYLSRRQGLRPQLRVTVLQPHHRQTGDLGLRTLTLASRPLPPKSRDRYQALESDKMSRDQLRNYVLELTIQHLITGSEID